MIAVKTYDCLFTPRWLIAYPGTLLISIQLLTFWYHKYQPVENNFAQKCIHQNYRLCIVSALVAFCQVCVSVSDVGMVHNWLAMRFLVHYFYMVQCVVWDDSKKIRRRNTVTCTIIVPFCKEEGLHIFVILPYTTKWGTCSLNVTLSSRFM